MGKLSIKDLAQTINDDCDNNEYFWAYGLVKGTIDLWKSEENKNLLCYAAKIMVDQVLEG
jgi:hypothetical protein